MTSEDLRHRVRDAGRETSTSTRRRTPRPRHASSRRAAFLRSVLHRIRGRVTLERLMEQGLELGDHVLVADPILIDPSFPWLVAIGDRSTLGPGVEVLAHDAAMQPHLGYTKLARTVIGRDVYIGARTIVLPGVTIGDESIIGAGSIVREDVPPRSLAVGSPAVVIGPVEEYLQRRRTELAGAQIFPAQGYTTATGVTDARRRQMQEAARRGPIFIEAAQGLERTFSRPEQDN